MSRPITTMERRLGRFSRRTRAAMARANQAADGVIRGFSRVGMAAAAAGAAIGIVGADVVRTGAEFEQAIISATAKFPGAIRRGTAEFAALEEAARRVGSETEFTASQAAGALDFLAMAGFDATQAISALPGVVDLATASGMDLARATDVASDSLGAFGLMTSDSEQLGRNLASVNDLIARTTTSANTNVEQLFEAITAGAPATRDAGQSMETFAAAAGVLANAGTKGAAAGTALRNMMLRLQAPAAAGAGQLERLRVSVEDSEGNMRDFFDILGDLDSAMEGMGTVERAGIMNDIFGTRAIGAASNLMEAGSDALREYRTQLENADGAAGDMAATMRDSTSGDLASFKSAIEGIKIAVFGVVRGPLREIIGSMTAWARENRAVIESGIRDFVSWLTTNLPTIVTWARRLAIIASVFLAAAAAVKIATTAMAIFNAVSALNPWVALAMGIIAAIGLIIAFWPEISAFFSELGDAVSYVAGEIRDWFVGAWDAVVSAVSSAIDTVSGIFMSAWTWYRDTWIAIFEFIAGLIVMLFRPLMPIIRPIIELLGEAADWIIEQWTGFWDWLVGFWGRFSAGFRLLWMGLSAGVSAIGTLLRTVFQAAWTHVTNVGQAALDRLRSAWSSISGFFASLWAQVASTFMSIVGPIFSAISNAIGQVRSLGASVLGTDGPDGDGGSASPQVASPQERTARQISERTNNNNTTVTIQDNTGRARLERRAPGVVMAPSGAV